MTKATETATIDAGSITARELVFRQIGGNEHHRYVLQADGTEDYLAFITRFPAHEVGRTTHYYIDDSDGAWFACSNVDCFDPPFAVIRARSVEDALEVFETEFEDWLKVDAADATDYPEDDRHYNGNGTHVDLDNVQIAELQLLEVRC